jgi:hypothetical protein
MLLRQVAYNAEDAGRYAVAVDPQRAQVKEARGVENGPAKRLPIAGIDVHAADCLCLGTLMPRFAP